jgi:hypothetical protein
MRRALVLPVLIVSLLAAAGCGGDGDGGNGDLANGKVFDPTVLKTCLRGEAFRIEPRETDIGIDFTVRWRSGLNNADVAVERDPAAAESREEEWKKLADEAGIDNIDDFYFRYGNVLIGYEKVPGKADRARIERCLSP